MSLSAAPLSVHVAGSFAGACPIEPKHESENAFMHAPAAHALRETAPRVHTVCDSEERPPAYVRGQGSRGNAGRAESISVKSASEVDWPTIREAASACPEEAFAFIRDGLAHTVRMIHGDVPRNLRADAAASDHSATDRYHVTGQQLCMGFRDLAIERYGLLARTVLGKWGVKRTLDFGMLVYALIDRGELRSSERDSLADFVAVYDFDEAFEQTAMR